jgi:aquaporin Z
MLCENLSTTAGIVVGSVIGLEATFAGPICGASMNPARSLAPAWVSAHLSSVWIYILTPVLGIVVGLIGCKVIHEKGLLFFSRTCHVRIR